MSVAQGVTEQSFARDRFSRSDAAIGLLVAGHFLFLALFFRPAISTPDANGYMAQARLIAREGRTDVVVESPVQYVGDHWMPVAPGRYYGQYPPGLPALLAVVFRSMGAYASLWVIPAMGSLALLGLYLVARTWVGPGWALLAVGLMAVNPYANQHALGADSHTAVCFFLIWALFGLVRWDASRAPGWAALTGFCLGVIPSIRYPEALFLVPFAVYVAFRSPYDGRWWRSVLVGLLGAGLPLAALAWRNQVAFGAFWKTGYSISGEQTGFTLGDFALHAVPYLVLLFIQGIFVVYVVGVRGLFELCRRPETRRQGRLLVGLIVPITLLYMAYYFMASMRFLLPTFALYTIAAVWWLQLRSETEPERARRWAKVVLVLTLLWGLPYSIISLNRLRRDNDDLARVTRLVEAHVAPGSLLIAQSGLQQHLDFLGDWKLASEEAFDRPARPHHPMGPRNFGPPPGPGPEDDPEVGPGPGPDRDPGPDPADALTPAEYTRAFRLELERWAGTQRPVYWLTTEDHLEAVKKRLDPSDSLTRVAEVALGGRPGGPPPEFQRKRADRGPGPRWGFLPFLGPPPPPPGRGGPGRDGPRPPGPGGPARFEPPADGKFVLVRWQIRGA